MFPKILRPLFAAGTLAWILGCAGGTEKLLELSGSKMDVQTGADAMHPADFPLPPPATGTLVTSANVNLMGMATTTVVYEISGDADATAVIAPYREAMEAKGLKVDVASGMEAGVTGTNPNATDIWTAGVVTDDDGKRMLTLVVVHRGGDDAGSE